MLDFSLSNIRPRLSINNYVYIYYIYNNTMNEIIENVFFNVPELQDKFRDNVVR